jgi:hypothetical protein
VAVPRVRHLVAKEGLLDTRAGTEALLSSIALDAGLGLIDAEETARALGEATGKDVSAAVADAVGRFGRAEVLAQSLAVAPDDATVLATCAAIVRELLDGDAPDAYGAPLKAALRVLAEHTPQSPELARAAELGISTDDDDA